jgi:hypothetical protein
MLLRRPKQLQKSQPHQCAQLYALWYIMLTLTHDRCDNECARRAADQGGYQPGARTISKPKNFSGCTLDVPYCE